MDLDYDLKWYEEAEMARYAGYTDNSGIQHESYDAACRYYGCDTPAQAQEEMEYYRAIENEAALDQMEARGGPAYDVFWDPYADDEIPF